MASLYQTRLHAGERLAQGQAVALPKEQAHYLRSVLRLTPGAKVALFNGQDGEWLAEIADLGKSSAILTPIRQLRPQAEEPDLWLVFAPVKHARIDFLAEKATELGVSALWPVFTQRTIVSRVNEDRMRANAIEAAEQSERLTVPQVLPPAKLAAALSSWPADRRLIVCDETGKGPPVSQALADNVYLRNAVLIGPEGGFTETELDGLRKLPFVTPVSLGPRVLRADTAALAALACFQAVAGDWQSGRPDFKADFNL
ncbi:MAG: 16S rRNA (uracil(1498)-N(3))-methyltransferase [Alphaproteobacteria bacterium]|nr:16S rRNA (uracil(1498)-N(3))-methyltransferase [Alphaproteobacteria bacterium]MBU0798221.1 16S rRNA (uracil(1498)-N(3))-methyltransferase [Alphaproteobacteria bacterium]MBU0888633.1 16S rRNA (uracil(1498)-N(3))-methyltransferase [Alphaproteobacteria bacterium]MBU1813633.1 16S rRNA (uracil(1498)-N(3))-methyltransferase [Alphaproteobacteria bacterium]MBU2091303.1 16S rRNA (uracil(1498)-N(3))-methyltransferase [Alphaproteobacteria bacterium]